MYIAPIRHMKNLILKSTGKCLALIFTLSLINTSFAGASDNFRFEAASAEELGSERGYRDDVLRIGGIEISRGQLEDYSGTKDGMSTCHEEGSKNFMDEPALENVINAALVSTIVHTALQARQDKQKHALVGAAIGFGASKLCEYIMKGEDNRFVCALTGAGAALLAGVAKEVYDNNGHGTVDKYDALYTFVPGAIVSFKFQL